MCLSDIYTIAVNLPGLPGMSIPCEPSGGLPVAVATDRQLFSGASAQRCPSLPAGKRLASPPGTDLSRAGARMKRGLTAATALLLGACATEAPPPVAPPPPPPARCRHRWNRSRSSTSRARHSGDAEVDPRQPLNLKTPAPSAMRSPARAASSTGEGSCSEALCRRNQCPETRHLPQHLGLRANRGATGEAGACQQRLRIRIWEQGDA